MADGRCRRADRRCDGPPAGIEYEARARRGGSLFGRRALVLAHTLFVYVVMRFGISVGGFVPKTYVGATGREFRFSQI